MYLNRKQAFRIDLHARKGNNDANITNSLGLLLLFLVTAVQMPHPYKVTTLVLASSCQPASYDLIPWQTCLI